MFGLHLALATPGGSEKRISFRLHLGLCPAWERKACDSETNLRTDMGLEDVGRSSRGPCTCLRLGFLRNLDSYYKATPPSLIYQPRAA